MEKSWVNINRNLPAYEAGLQRFLDITFDLSGFDSRIKCPCKKCSNSRYHTREVVFEHLLLRGWDVGYAHNLWVFHGELRLFESMTTSESDSHESDEVRELVHDAFGIHDNAHDFPNTTEEPNENAQKFYNLLKDAEQELYPSCENYTKLSFLVELFNIKCLNGWSDKSVTMLLKLLKKVLPAGEKLPNTFYHTKKVINDLGLGYVKIDACPNDCILFRKEHAMSSSCPVCHANRWKCPSDAVVNTSVGSRRVSSKVLRHFPLIPRLQRLFMSSKTASLMSWHSTSRNVDGKVRHPADSRSWADLDARYPEFAMDPRNVRLGLATDGFNPFGMMNVSHSTLPVLLMPYNLPPWLCMKQPFLIMSLLIPGPRAPGNDIDVYMQPLIDELKELRDVGIITFDAAGRQNFVMCGAVLWTISDFPAYANLSGWSTKGRYACPHCNDQTCSYYLKHGHKFCYMGHRRFLELNHAMRFDPDNFDGHVEIRPPPPLRMGTELHTQAQSHKVTFGKNTNGKKRKKDMVLPTSWKKLSIFFSLPYWEHLLIRHNLDVMHIEKNVCDSVIGTLLNIEGKSKENLNTRLDLQDMCIRPWLHPIDNGNRVEIPKALFFMTIDQQRTFCTVLHDVRVPDGYGSNLSRCMNVKDRCIQGVKSHDYHIIMQQLLPIAVRSTMRKEVSRALIELSVFFRELCTKVGTPDGYRLLQSKICITMCKLEKIFPPSFFDVMVHLVVHLANEAIVAGPVHYRWMYPIERYLGTLKSYVRNRSHPEGSIAEGYLAQECLTFCSRYLSDAETKSTRLRRNNDDTTTASRSEFCIFKAFGCALGKVESNCIDYTSWTQMHKWVLFNCPELSVYLSEHQKALRMKHPNKRALDLDRMHNEEFHGWFREAVRRSSNVLDDVCRLSWGPNQVVSKYKKFLINGYRFRTKDADSKCKTQNSGVLLKASGSNYERVNDTTPAALEITYYGVLKEIFSLDYGEGRNVVLFKCDWVNSSATSIDDLGITIVNLDRLQPTDEPFILASQAQQVFYVQDPIRNEWFVPIPCMPRETYDMGAVGVSE